MIIGCRHPIKCALVLVPIYSKYVRDKITRKERIHCLIRDVRTTLHDPSMLN